MSREGPVLSGDRAVLGPFPSVSPGPRVLRAIAGAVIGKARPLIDALALRSGQSRGRRQPRARRRWRRPGSNVVCPANKTCPPTLNDWLGITGKPRCGWRRSWPDKRGTIAEIAEVLKGRTVRNDFAQSSRAAYPRRWLVSLGDVLDARPHNRYRSATSLGCFFFQDSTATP